MTPFFTQRALLRYVSSAVVLGLLATVLLFGGIPKLGGGDVAVADEVAPLTLAPATPNRPITFRDRLIAGLRARLQSEIDFVDKVVDAVETGKLPQRTVDQAYFWARTRSNAARDGRTYRPIVYFQPAMRIIAKKVGVDL